MKRSDWKDWTTMVDELKALDLPESAKLAQAFDWATRRTIEYADQEIELAKAMGDQETVVKRQIKMSTMKHARSIFEDCYRVLIGRSAWDEQDDS